MNIELFIRLSLMPRLYTKKYHHVRDAKTASAGTQILAAVASAENEWPDLEAAQVREETQKPIFTRIQLSKTPIESSEPSMPLCKVHVALPVITRYVVLS